MILGKPLLRRKGPTFRVASQQDFLTDSSEALRILVRSTVGVASVTVPSDST